MSLPPHPFALGEAHPSGENLEYDPLFAALERAAQPRAERQAGNEILPAEEPDFREVADKALAVLERSHDLRAAAHLAHARLRLDGLPEFAAVLEYLQECLEAFWGTCHPQLDAEEDDDPTMRVNAVLGLVDPAGVLWALARTPLADSRMLGRFAWRDIAIARGEWTGSDEATAEPRAIEAALRETDPEKIAAIRAGAAAALAATNAISRTFDDRIPGRGPDLAALQTLLHKIGRHLAETFGEGAALPKAVAAPEGPAPPRPGTGAVDSRADVVAALDRIIAYYERNEPSSPLPLLLTRAKKLVNADFLTIIRELAPSGIDNVNLVGGLESE